MGTLTRRGRGIEIAHGHEMARLLAETEVEVPDETAGQGVDYAVTPAFVLPAVVVKLPRRRERHSG
jgi:hypothetical protein